MVDRLAFSRSMQGAAAHLLIHAEQPEMASQAAEMRDLAARLQVLGAGMSLTDGIDCAPSLATWKRRFPPRIGRRWEPSGRRPRD